MSESLWTSGDWQVELRDDEFANIKFQNQIVLRSVRAVIRDRDWNTADLVIDSTSKSPNEIKFFVHSKGFGAVFFGEICARFDGTVATFTMELVSKIDYQSNRTGLIVLHSPDCAGAALKVSHSNGQQEELEFPKSISPNQPVFDISSLSWKQNHLQIDIAFAGDVFEMEDQRNWSDASYKTYNRPLSLPFPYPIATNEKVLQTVKIQVKPISAPSNSVISKNIELLPTGKFASMQVGAATAPQTATQPKSILNNVLVELDLQTPNWQAALQRAANSATSLDVRLVADSNSNLKEAISKLAGLNISRIAIFDSKQHVTTQELFSALKNSLAENNLDLPIVSGARSHFTELNREQVQIVPGATQITFATTPLFHSQTDAQFYESVAMQRLIAEQAVEIANGKPVHIGPICLRPRFNNVATAQQPSPTRSDLSQGYGAQFTSANDYRQTQTELAAWVIASAAALLVPGVHSLTWFEQWGPRGLVSETGEEYPAAKAVRALAELEGQDIYIGESPDGFIWALAALDQKGQITILASNLNAQPVKFDIKMSGKVHQVELGARSWKKL